jgi:antitoxin HigA-1
MAMNKPAHPGRIVRTMCLEPCGLSVTKAAKGLGVSRQALNNLVNQKSAVSPDMAVRLEKGFGISAEMWLSMQLAYDLANAYKNARSIRVKPFKSAA